MDERSGHKPASALECECRCLQPVAAARRETSHSGLMKIPGKTQAGARDLEGALDARSCKLSAGTREAAVSSRLLVRHYKCTERISRGLCKRLGLASSARP